MSNLKPYTPKVMTPNPAAAVANEVEAGDLSAARSAAQLLKARPTLQAQAKAHAQQVRAKASGPWSFLYIAGGGNVPTSNTEANMWQISCTAGVRMHLHGKAT
jgi:hypothetical protein